ncbi:GHKL domain protein [Leptospira ellinghausenii]|uniref:GHKL domain protein n=1 Tax=Leptospira ellinghausenii TaxID=1917822 RepID=A0A2P2DC47_9LEPT|nr:DUF6272 family protein [Leptospira ellinghausenii]GBF42211.1 GHKL domain protein [Leptospira ellinghausenii]
MSFVCLPNPMFQTKVVTDFSPIHLRSQTNSNQTNDEKNLLLQGNIYYHSQLSISVSVADMAFYWKRCDVLSNFISQFYFHSFESKQLDQNTISTVINELVENAAKYSDKEESKIHIEIKDLGNQLRIEVKNIITPWMKAIFENKIQTIQSHDINELYFEALEAHHKGIPTFGLGLLRLLKDYQLPLAYEFTKLEGNDFEITMRAHLFISETETL